MTEGQSQQPTLFGHPTGLFTLFFAEMWERFSYYGMRALLTFYMIKGFLGYTDKGAYAVYGAYTALVYMTPFFGGMLADRLLGQRRAVIIGGGSRVSSTASSAQLASLSPIRLNTTARNALASTASGSISTAWARLLSARPSSSAARSSTPDADAD